MNEIDGHIFSHNYNIQANWGFLKYNLICFQIENFGYILDVFNLKVWNLSDILHFEMHKLNITLQPQMESSVMYLKITKPYFSKPWTAKTIQDAT